MPKPTLDIQQYKRQNLGTDTQSTKKKENHPGKVVNKVIKKKEGF